jgi:hypothetical protein
MKEVWKLVRERPEAQARYVFFSAPGFRLERQKSIEGIEVWSIDI